MNKHTYMEMKMKMKNNNQFKNEGRILKMKMNNHLEMNTGNESEMNHRNELEMNNDLEMKPIVEMNQDFINNKGEKIIMENKRIGTEENVIEKIKRESYNINSNYVPSIKLITDEPAKVILNTLKRDLRNYQEIWGFICHGNTITMRLKTNAEPVIYYFQKYDNLEEILIELVKFCQKNNLQIIGISD